MYSRFNKRPSTYNNWLKNPVGAIVLQLFDKEAKKQFHFASGHFAWTKKSYITFPAQIQRANILRQFLRKLNTPIILAADTNVDPDLKVIRQFENIGLRNLTLEYKFNNTLNPKQTNHYQDIFVNDPIQSKRGGVACDNILISKENFTIDSYKVLNDDVSDHFPLELVVDFV